MKLYFLGVCVYVYICGMYSCGSGHVRLWRPKVNTEYLVGDLPAFTSPVLGLHVGAVHPNAGTLPVAASIAGTLPVAASMAGSLLVVSHLTSPRIYFLSGRSDRECAEVYLTFEKATWPHQISP